ncbi:WD40 repeat domain-containing protein [Okeanomitos corallinicola TIOX110]|uniref:WD40 repeat domain-containing protein n=1 Tax=Okeanomitos corallinicola TIOX110 TaxID=3133117 RepID=A0ABZ2UYF0_9CYAN
MAITREEFEQAYSSLTKSKLTKTEKNILWCFFQHHDKTFKEIADILSAESKYTKVITQTNINSIMSNIYKKFGVTVKVGKKYQLINLLREYKPNLFKNIPRNRKKIIINNPQQDLADIDVSTNFYGRLQDIKSLENKILADKYKLLILTGIYGIGKTSLAVELAKKIKGEFHFSMGLSLEKAPPLKKVLTNIIKILSKQNIIELPQDVNKLISLLIEYFKEYRCLLILDNLETILQSGDRTGQYKDKYQEYSQLFHSIITAEHQSCLLLTSREIPLAYAEAENSSVSIFTVNGLEVEDAKNMIINKGLVATNEEFQQLVQRYECHPLILKLIIQTIKKLQVRIVDFLDLKFTNLDKITSILDWHFQRLSDVEKQIIYWLAINREVITFKELQDDIKESPFLTTSISSLELLLDRSLINKSALGFKLQSVIMEDITERLITEVCAELTTGKLQIFKSHALMKATAKDYVRETQNQLIVKPIIDKLLNQFNNKFRLEFHLKQILLQLKSEQNIGYAGGNLINILATLQIDLTNYDFSQINIMQAFLKDVNLHNVNFQNTNFYNSVFQESIAAIFALAFSPDGEILAISDYRGTIQLMDIQSRQKILTINDSSGHVVRALAFSNDGKILAGGSTNGTIQLWDVKTSELLNNLSAHTDWVNSIAFNADGKILASGSSDSTIKIWEVATGKSLNILSGHSDCVHAVAFGSQGILASGSRDKTIRLWDINKKESFHTLTEHTESVYAVAFSNDGKILVSGSGDSTVRIWDFEKQTSQSLVTLKKHNNKVLTVAFSSDGKILASGGYDTDIQIWDIEDVKNIKHINTLQEHENWIRAVVFSPQGNIFVSGDVNSIVKLWNLKDVNNINSPTSWQGHTSEIRTVAFSPQGNILISGSSDKKLRLWNVNEDVNNAKMTDTLTGHTDIVYSIALNSQGTTLASGSADSTVKLWDVASRQYIKTLRGHKNHVRCVAFSDQSQHLASGSRDCSVKLWDIDSVKCQILLQEDTESIDAIAFHPYHEILAYGIYKGDVKLWDIKTQKCIKILPGHSTRINSLAFHPQGNILASASNDNTIRLWNTNSYECLAVLDQHTNWVRSVAFHPQGDILASGSGDGTVRFWDMISYEAINILQEHSDWVHSVTFSLCGKILASGSADETIKLWDVKTGACLQTLTIPKPYQGMNITRVTGLTPEVKATLKALGAVEVL